MMSSFLNLMTLAQTAGEIFLEKAKFVVDNAASFGYTNQAVFSREQRFAAVLELVDRPA